MLTPAQQKAKERVEAEGGTFVAPGKYNPNNVASHYARKKYSNVFSDLSPQTDAIVDQVLDPEAAPHVSRWPNTYGLSATYRCKNIINASFDQNGRSSVTCHPRLRSAISATSGSQFIGLLPQQADGNPAPFCIEPMSLQAGQTHEVVQPIIFAQRQLALPKPSSQVGQMIYPFGIDCNVNVIASLVFRFPGATSSQMKATFSFYDTSFNLVHTESGLTNSGGQLLVTVSNAEIGVGNARWFSVTTEALHTGFVGNAVMSFFTAGTSIGDASYVLSNESQHHDIYDLKDSDSLLENAERFFVSAQSMLITSEMSSLNDGGVIATARLPGGSVVGDKTGDVTSSTWYDWIASLPNNSYDGAVKNGAYSFYVGDDERSYFYRDVNTLIGNELPQLVAEFTASDTTEASIVRIKIVTVVQFTTNASIFQSAPSPILPQLAQMHQLLSVIQSSYCNRSHKSDLKKNLRRAGKQLVKLLKNPRTYKTAAEIASAMMMVV